MPGSASAFGLALPSNTDVRFESDTTRMYHVNAQMPRVMRYLQQRIEYTVSDIHPLGAMIRSAHLRDVSDGAIFDVGVRDEGDRTLVTVWNRTPIPSAPRSMEDGMRAANMDPRTQHVLARYNR
jgi:hypothetical protein